MPQKTAKTSVKTLTPFDRNTGLLNVVIGTPKGSRNKYKFGEELGLFRLNKILPVGSVFPFDFGFVPSTRGGDRDPLDVLLLLDEPAFTGCVVSARPIGLIEAEQTEEGKTIRNDRLVAAPAVRGVTSQGKSLEDLGEGMLSAIERFLSLIKRWKGRSSSL